MLYLDWPGDELQSDILEEPIALRLGGGEVFLLDFHFTLYKDDCGERWKKSS